MTGNSHSFYVTANMNIDRPVFNINVSPPDVVQQLFTTVYTFGMCHKNVINGTLLAPYPAVTHWLSHDEKRDKDAAPCTSILYYNAVGAERRITALIRAVSSFRENGS